MRAEAPAWPGSAAKALKRSSWSKPRGPGAELGREVQGEDLGIVLQGCKARGRTRSPRARPQRRSARASAWEVSAAQGEWTASVVSKARVRRAPEPGKPRQRQCTERSLRSKSRADTRGSGSRSLARPAAPQEPAHWERRPPHRGSPGTQKAAAGGARGTRWQCESRIPPRASGGGLPAVGVVSASPSTLAGSGRGAARGRRAERAPPLAPPPRPEGRGCTPRWGER